ncbi:hypothetical protein, partial [Bacteroides muris (ex Fokt et al. 2023)]
RKHRMMNWCNSYRTDGKRNDCYYHILAMAAYSNERVAAIVVSVLYRMLTFSFCEEHNGLCAE